MSVTTEDGQRTEFGKILDWRMDQLLEAGYTPENGAKIARRLDVDLHSACELLKNGCEQDLAVRILL